MRIPKERDRKQHKGFYKAFYINQLVKPILILFRTGDFIAEKGYQSSRGMIELNEVKHSDMKRDWMNWDFSFRKEANKSEMNKRIQNHKKEVGFFFPFGMKKAILHN